MRWLRRRRPASRGRRRPTVLVAGHDLKFLRGIMARWEHEVEVLVDEWRGHRGHDEQRSAELLARADVVWCEWLLGNANWYAEHVADGQRLAGRLLGQELRTDVTDAEALRRFDAIAVVGPRPRRQAIERWRLDDQRVVHVPNAVDTSALSLPKHAGAEQCIGMVGMVPASKRPDLALDVVARVREQGSPARLLVRSKHPDELPWLQKRPDEVDFFQRVLARIDEDPVLADAVELHPHGGDMAEWYRRVGHVLSTSDFESFHLSVAEGAASGAVPTLLPWAGSDELYPPEWIVADVDAAADRIVGLMDDDAARAERAAAAQELARRFDVGQVAERLLALALGR